MYNPWGDREASRQAPFGRVREVGGGLGNHQNSLQTPSQWTELPAAAPDSSQHPVNTVHLGYLLFERCDKQWQPCIVNTWAHGCWICPENLSRVEPKCTLTWNKPLVVTEGAALGGHGLCQTSSRSKGGSDKQRGSSEVGLEKEGCWLHSLLALLLSRNRVQDQIIQRKQTLS